MGISYVFFHTISWEKPLSSIFMGLAVNLGSISGKDALCMGGWWSPSIVGTRANVMSLCISIHVNMM
jgi:hypothetical protein